MFGAGKLHLRGFIDGIEVPVIGARATGVEGGPATVEVQMIATDEIYEILPRSLITLFVYDNDDYERDENGIIEDRRLSPNDLRRYKLLFMGELAGVQFSKTESERQAVLIAVDHTNYWDYIRQHYVNFSNGGVELFENAFLGVDSREVKNFDVITKDMQSNIFVWLAQSEVIDPKTGKPEASIYLGAHRLLRELYFASSDFYAQAFNRLRIGDQIVGLPQDQTAGRLLKLSFFEKFIKNQIGGAGGLVTLRQVLGTMLGNVFHSHVTVPFPWLDRKGQARGFTVKTSSKTKKADQELAEKMLRRDAYPTGSLNYTILKPDTTFVVPPACNIIFPHQYSSVSYQRNYLEEPTRLFLRTSLIFTGQDKWITERFYAPDFKVFNQLLYAQGGYLKRMASVILPHERYVGLNPVEAWQDDIAAYVQKGARREYLSKLADYLFWKYRFSTRTLNVSMPLNMNLVPGYPALVMEAVGGPQNITKHWLGNVQTVVHSIDQNGGWTHITMVGARLHDENIDFDEGVLQNGVAAPAQTLEEITSRGADGFLDDRYEPLRIGNEVYKQLFGIGSLTDFLGALYDVDDPDTDFNLLRDQVLFIRSPVIRSIAELQILYRLIATQGGDVHKFAQSVTNRPKANLVEIMGIPASLDNLSPADLEQIANLYRTLPQSEWEGFMSVAVDPNAADLAYDSFISSKKTKTVYRAQQQEISRPEKLTESEFEIYLDVGVIDPPLSPQPAPETIYIPEQITQAQTFSYELKSILEERQAKVQAYIDSLKDRGIRG